MAKEFYHEVQQKLTEIKELADRRNKHLTARVLK